jgi:arsenite transporter
MTKIWAPFITPTMAAEYTAGMILLGIAPCTAMVFVWSYLSGGNMGHTLVMVAINSLTMLFFYAPLGNLLLGVAMPIPLVTLALTVGVYVGVPLVAGYLTRKILIQRKGWNGLKACTPKNGEAFPRSPCWPRWWPCSCSREK